MLWSIEYRTEWHPCSVASLKTWVYQNNIKQKEKPKVSHQLLTDSPNFLYNLAHSISLQIQLNNMLKSKILGKLTWLSSKKKKKIVIIISLSYCILIFQKISCCFCHLYISCMYLDLAKLETVLQPPIQPKGNYLH